jgi:hypothetical protein
MTRIVDAVLVFADMRRIYRTTYASSSKQQWQDLIEKIRPEAKEETAIVTDSEKNDPIFQKV